MPTRPAPLCATMGCPNKQPCSAHPRRSWNVNPFRGTTKQRGYSGRHVWWRATVLAQHPDCTGDPPNTGCRERNVATVADHLVPLSMGGTWDLENGQGLCRSCHAAKSARESRMNLS